MELTPEENLQYLNDFYNRLLEHRYRYYILDNPVLNDFEYDWLEREYNKLASQAGVKLMEMVDFNLNDPLAIEAGNRVEAGTDYHSLWEKEMEPVWTKLGKTNKQQKADKA